MSLVRCPICEKLFDPDNSPAMPFCSERCRLTDLSRWLDERYTLSDATEEKPESPED